jgi:hypothetical protein
VARHKNTTAIAATATVVIRLLNRWMVGGGGGISRYRHNHTKNTPTPYPTASAIPAKTPSTAYCRGNSDGVSAAAKNSVATARPTKEKDAQNRPAIDRRRETNSGMPGALPPVAGSYSLQEDVVKEHPRNNFHISITDIRPGVYAGFFGP